MKEEMMFAEFVVAHMVERSRGNPKVSCSNPDHTAYSNQIILVFDQKVSKYKKKKLLNISVYIDVSSYI